MYCSFYKELSFSQGLVMFLSTCYCLLCTVPKKIHNSTFIKFTITFMCKINNHEHMASAFGYQAREFGL